MITNHVRMIRCSKKFLTFEGFLIIKMGFPKLLKLYLASKMSSRKLSSIIITLALFQLKLTNRKAFFATQLNSLSSNSIRTPPSNAQVPSQSSLKNRVCSGHQLSHTE